MSDLPSYDAIDREFRPKVLRYMAGMVDAQEAPDLTQAALMKVSEHLREFRGESSMSTWIYRIAANVAIDRLRRKPMEQVTDEAEAEDDVADEAVPPELRSPSTESAAERREMSACVREFVERLPVTYRNVVLLAEIEGFSNAEIAQVTGLSVDVVKIRLHRGRSRLKAELEKGCAFSRDEENGMACERAVPIHFK